MFPGAVYDEEMRRELIEVDSRWSPQRRLRVAVDDDELQL